MRSVGRAEDTRHEATVKWKKIHQSSHRTNSYTRHVHVVVTHTRTTVLMWPIHNRCQAPPPIQFFECMRVSCFLLPIDSSVCRASIYGFVLECTSYDVAIVLGAMFSSPLFKFELRRIARVTSVFDSRRLQSHATSHSQHCLRSDYTFSSTSISMCCEYGKQSRKNKAGSAGSNDSYEWKKQRKKRIVVFAFNILFGNKKLIISFSLLTTVCCPFVGGVALALHNSLAFKWMNGDENVCVEMQHYESGTIGCSFIPRKRIDCARES